MANGVESLIQTDLQAILTAAAIQGINQWTLGMVPTTTEGLLASNLPTGFIVPRYGADLSNELGFEGSVNNLYVEEVIVIFGLEGDLLTDQPAVQEAKEAALKAVNQNADGSWRTTLPTATTVYDLRIGEVKGIDPSKLPDNYAHDSFFVKLSSSE